MKRVTLVKVHMLIAAFLFPVALMFLVTGALYTWGITGGYESRDLTLTLSKPLTKDLKSLQQLTETELAGLGVSAPSGKPRIREVGTAFLFEWTGSQRDILLRPLSNPLQAELTIKETSWYRAMVQLHKAKGGTLFKIYAATFAVGLLILLVSGFVMAWQVPSFRRITLISTVSGVLVFLGMLALS